ncbi:Receptor-type tyrosine-protein phosphatase alpha [Chionoecetes opilio]|uniref:Receptor-type tyrosine-protein phosphatase alpha n=1 Tax=Chionoecetes opilio TaxID=41210 RepID=A0A8J4XR56_CHIOP|nr:Receptor-type tyrosine-protein phosphatase alpha [Chionoecetes opilio]
MQREGGQPRALDWQKKLMDAAVSLVSKEEEREARGRRSAKQEPAGTSSMFIAATVVQEGREQVEVTVDGSTTEGHHSLEKDVAYLIVVVTEKRNGIQERVPYLEEHPLAVLPAGDEDIYMNVTYQVMEKDLEAYLLRAVMSRDTKIEFDNVPLFMSTNHAESERPENCSKNRYKNKVIYDDTRVILPLYNDIPHTDYINASYVEGPTQPAAFIATQGPKEETVGAFWRMMWHSKCNIILMVANLKEGQKVKVAQYWPESKPWLTEGITVTPTDINVKMDFVIRSFTMSVGNTQRKITQYQYTAWPDHGVPKISYGLAQMIKLVLRDKHTGGPLTVHCSAGIGRTGTVILVLFLLDQLEARGTANPSEALTALRRGRGRLVENTVSGPPCWEADTTATSYCHCCYCCCHYHCCCDYHCCSCHHHY